MTRLTVGFVTNGFPQQMTGVKIYEYNLLRYLKDNVEIDIVPISPQYMPGFAADKQIILQNPFKGISDSYLWFPYAVTRLDHKDIDLLHFPSQIPFIQTKRYNSVATIHDLSVFTYAHTHPWMRVFLHKLLLKRYLTNQKLVITNSECTKTDVVRHLGIESSRVFVTPLAASEKFYRVTPQQAERVRRKYNLPSKFILNVGTIEPRKNPHTLLKSFLSLKKNDLWLVYVGKAGWKCGPFIDYLKQKAYGSKVIWLGYVDFEDLPSLYSAAELFVYPSFYEGFGIPVLEALKCGVPTIVSNKSSLPEVVGNAALVIDPNNSNELKNAILNAMNNIDLRERLQIEGPKQASKFSWQKTCQATIKAYKISANLSGGTSN